MSYRDKFFGSYFDYMSKALEGLALQQKAIADNIANVNNANYQPLEVSFQDQLQQILAAENGDPQELEIKFDFDPEFKAAGPKKEFKPQVTRSPEPRVDLNQQMANLAKTQILYGFAADAIKPSWTKYVIETLTR